MIDNLPYDLQNYQKVGTVSDDEIRRILRNHWYLLDLSQAFFEIRTDDPVVQGFVCHGRAMAYQPKKRILFWIPAA